MLRGSLARASLRLSVVPGLGPLERYAWVDDALQPAARVRDRVRPDRRRDRAARRVPAPARSSTVAAYSGQLESASAGIEDACEPIELKAVVATSALGHGLRQARPGVLHPRRARRTRRSPTTSRSAGPAVRSTSAMAVLCPAETDERLWDYFATAAMPDPTTRRNGARTRWRAARQRLPALEAATGVRRGRLETLLKIVAVDGAVVRSREGGVAHAAPSWYFDEAKWSALRAVRAAEADLMRAYAARSGLPDAVPAAGARRSGSAAVRSVLGVHGRAARARERLRQRAPWQRPSGSSGART